MSTMMPSWMLTKMYGAKESDIPDWIKGSPEPSVDPYEGSTVDAEGENPDSIDVTELQDIPDFFEGDPNEIRNWDFTYFKPHEFASKGDGQVKISGKVVQGLDNVRSALGYPIKITSGYRDHAHNKRIKGASNSQHVHGKAVDINLNGMDEEQRTQLMVALIKEGFTSFGSYTRSPNMLHADMRPNKAKWHHGKGTHPDWFIKALKEGGWTRG